MDKPLRPCRKVGCGELTQDGYCHNHKPKDIRESANKRGYNSKWRWARKNFLMRNPFCVRCAKQGYRGVLATVVDHIIPHKGDRELFWNKDNWQPLCETCHNRKTVREDGGFGNNSPGKTNFG